MGLVSLAHRRPRQKIERLSGRISDYGLEQETKFQITDWRKRGWRARLARLRAHRQGYARSLDWLFSFYHRALLRLPSVPLPFRRRVRAVRLASMPAPVYVRLNTSDWYVLEEVFLDQVYEPATLRETGKVERIVDLGANTGFSALWWRKHYAQALIVAVEPDRENSLMFARNVAGHAEAEKIQLVRACVAGSPRKVALDRAGGSWRFRMSERDPLEADEAIEALTLPQILEETGMAGSIDVLKCDVEGAEAEIFADCAAWIGLVKQLIVEVHRPYTVEALLEDLSHGGASSSFITA